MKAKLINKALAWLMTLTMVVSMLPVSVFAAGGNVAKVGDTEYATIDKAIAAWTNGTTLTLLDDVTLSDVIKLSSTEHHILDLGTYTMTAASGKDAIQYVVNGRSSMGVALDIKADATNPGGITATGGSVVRHTKPLTGAPSKDRPLTRFYGGVFNASYVVRQGGTFGAGYTGASAPGFYFYGGEFNGTIYTNRSLNQFHGGTFNGSMQMSVDSSAYTQIAGGTFKNLSNAMGSSLNSDKFVIGTAKGANDGSVCIDENGNYVVTTTTPAAAEASVASNYNSNNYFYYSTVNTSGMYYEDVYDALEANTTGEVTVFTDELDMTQVADFEGTIVVPEGETVTITVAEGTTPTWSVEAADGTEANVTYVDENNTVLEKSEDGSFVAPVVNNSGVVIADTLTGEVVDEIKVSTALQNYEPVNVPEGAELVIELTEAESFDKIVYDVAPMIGDTQAELTKAITFRLPVPASVSEKIAVVYHDGVQMDDLCAIRGEGNGKYVEVSSKEFSEFAVEPTTPTEGYYLTIYNADGTVGMNIDGIKSASDFSLKSAIEDARVFVNNAFLFGITTPATIEVEMFEDSTEDESFEIGSDVTVNGNGFSIVCAEGVEVTVADGAKVDAEIVKTEPAVLTLSDFVAAVVADNGNYDGEGATFVITPASGDARTETVEGLPNRLQNYSNPEVYYAQYQRFSELTDVSISNVNFVFVPADVTVVDAWNTAGATTTADNINGELQLMNAGSVTLTGCTFDKMSVSPISATSVIVSDCEFSGLNAYAIKDIKASTVSVTDSTFTDCSGAFWMSTAPATLTVTGNDFVNVGRRGAIQFSANGDYTNTAMNVTGNEVTGGAFLWQLNPTVTYEQVSAILDTTKNTYETAYVDNSIEPAAPAYVAEVNGVEYTDLQEAIVAAAPSGTVELLSDVTVDKWVMISETLSIGSGQIITLDMDGLTIDGNGYTLTVNAIESATNGNHLIYDGDYNVQDLTIEVADGVRGGLGITSGTISNVTFVGGNVGVILSDGVVTGVHAGDVTIEGCTFKVNGSAIYYESAQDGLVVNDNTFEIPSTANVIVMYGAEKFTNNTVVSGRTVNVAGGSPVVTGNDFGDVRFKVYNDATATIENNTINNLVFNDETAQQSTFANNTMSQSAQAALDAVTPKVAKIGDAEYGTLAEAIAAAQTGDTVKLLADIELSGIVSIPNGKGLTIDGDGHKFTPAADFATNGNGAVLVLADGAIDYSEVGYTLKNLTFEGFSGLSRVVRANFGDIVIENCEFKNNNVTGGVITSSFANLTVTGCAFDGNTVSGFGVIDVGSDVSNGTEVVANITNSSFTNNDVAFSVLFLFSDASATGNYFSGNTHIGDAANAAAVLAGPYAGTEAYTIKVSENAFVNALSKDGQALPAVFAEDWSNLGNAFDISANYWDGVEPAQDVAYKTAGTVTGLKLDSYYTTYEDGVLSDLVEISSGLSGSGTEEDPYLIKSIDDLILFRNSVNAGETTYNAEGVYVALGDNIDMAGIDWSVNIGDDCSATFDGIFDGKGHTISNLTAVETAEKGDGYVCGGLFGAIYGSAVIKNLTIENVTIDAGFTGNNVGAVVGFAYNCTGSVENVKVIGNIAINAAEVTGVGAIVGYDYYGNLTVEGCSVVGNDGSYITGAAYVGGVIGYASSNSNISNNTVENVAITAQCGVGGVAGIMLGSGKAVDNTVKAVALTVTHENWQNSAAAVVGTISGGSITVSNTTVESVTANGAATTTLVGANMTKEHPTTPVGKVEARIGDVYYGTLAAALKANVEGEVELLTPITIAAGETLTLDKAVTITYTSNVPGEDMITNRGTLVIDGATLVYTSTDTTGSNVTVSTISCEPGSVLTVNSGVVKNDSVNNSNGGAGSFAYAVDLVTNGGLGDVTATINGGEVISTNYMAIRQFVNGEVCKNTLTVNDGTIKGATRGINIQLKNNMAYTTITGGTIEGGDYSLCFLTTSENLSVTGGEFTGEVWYSGTDGFISGGTFKTEPDAAYAADGYQFVANEDGTYGVVEAITELFTLAGITTSLDSSLALNIYYTPVSGATAADYYAVVAHQKEDAVAEMTIPYADWGTSGSKKLIRYTGLAAKEMADELTVTIYDADGNAVSKPFTTSFRAYAIGTMSSGQYNPTEHRVWFTALTDMLNYGAAAQQMFGYKTDNLANAGADEFQQYASTEYTLSTDGFSMSGTAWAPSLTLESTILLNAYFDDVTEGMYATYSYTTHAGTPVSATVDYDSFVSSWGHFGVSVPIAIADAGTPVTVTMFNADGSVAGTMTCSANNYLKGMIENDPDVALYPALAKFAASAKAAFAD